MNRPAAQQIGVVLGDARYYASKRLRDVAETTARFYEHWTTPRTANT